jgi:hypothetical protein
MLTSLWPFARTMIILAIILFALWVGGFLVFHIASFLIHLLLIAAIVVILIRVIQGRPPLG